MKNIKIQERKRQYQRDLKEQPLLYRAAESFRQYPEDETTVVCNYVLGPALAEFVLWVLQDALRTGKKRLYFLARDGYLMYRAALIFCGRFHLPLECKYLSCSRYSIRIPSFHLNQKAALEYLCRDGLEVTPEKIFLRAGLTKEEMEEMLPKLQLPYSGDSFLTRLELQKFRKELENCELFLNAVSRHSREEFPNLAGYLRQEGLLDSVSDAVVDSGWTGSMQKILNGVLACMGRKKKLEGYYWGLYELPKGSDSRLYHSYYFTPKGNIRRKVFFNNCLFEAAFSAPHGMTLRYQSRGGNYFPVYGRLESARKDFSQKEGAYLLEYIQNLATEMKTFPTGKNPAWKSRKTIEKLLRRFMCSPTFQEAKAFGNLPFSDDVLEKEDRPLAGRRNRKKCAWQEGYAVLHKKHYRRYLRQHTLYQYIRYWKKEWTGNQKG